MNSANVVYVTNKEAAGGMKIMEGCGLTEEKVVLKADCLNYICTTSLIKRNQLQTTFNW